MGTETLQCFRHQTLSEQIRPAINRLVSLHLKHEKINENTGKKDARRDRGIGIKQELKVFSVTLNILKKTCARQVLDVLKQLHLTELFYITAETH